MIALIGSRKAPRPVLNLATRLGSHFSNLGVDASSGGAPGMDQAFMARYAPEHSRIFMPNSYFYGQAHNGLDYIDIHKLPKQVIMKAWLQAKSVTSGFDMLADHIQCLFARNALQILDVDCETPVQLCLYWTPVINGMETGGTRIAVRIARKYGVPCHNLWIPEVYQHYSKMMNVIHTLDEL